MQIYDSAGKRKEGAAGGAGDGYNILAAGSQTANTTGTVVFSNSNGVTFGMSNNSVITASVGGAAAGSLSAGAASMALGQVIFSNSNSVSFGLNGSTVTATVAYPAQTNQTLGLYASSNTTAAGSSTTLDARTVTFRGMGILSVGYSAGEVILSVPAGGGAGDGVNIIAAGTQTANTTGTVIFSNSNGVSFGMSNNSVVTAQFSEATLQTSAIGWKNAWAQSSSSLGQNTLYIYPEGLGEHVSAVAAKFPIMMTNSSSAAASVQRGHTIRFGIYTMNSSNTTAILLHYSTSYTIAASHSSNVSWRLSLITAIGNSTSYNTLTASSAGINLSSSLHGPREIILPISSLLTPGSYWWAHVQSSSSAGAAGNVLNLSHIIASSQTQNRVGLVTNATNIGIAQNIGLGTYSATTGALPSSINLTQINQAATWPVFYLLPNTQ